jgi:hypothetical protein
MDQFLRCLVVGGTPGWLQKPTMLMWKRCAKYGQTLV